MLKNDMEENRVHRILIVDDVPKNIQLIANFLTKEGYLINFALDGVSALEHVTRETFDLILLDVMMPGMDGIEVCKRIKKSSEFADIPVIFITAKTDNDTIARGFEAGGVDYVVKPFNPTELLARVRTHLNLRKREKELVELNNTKNTILSIIGHDLKTPLANIISLGEIIVNSNDISKEEQDELLGDLVDSGYQGVWLLENLLSWTRIQTGSISNQPEEIDVSAIVQQNLDFIFQNAQHKNIRLEKKCEEGLKIFADRNIVHTIFRNLLSNGIKFTHPGGNLTVWADKTRENEICIRIIDTGVGIVKEKLENIFTTIGLASTDGTENEKGSGLGLVLVRELMDIMKARIEVESIVSKGTTFSLYFRSYE